MNENEQRIAIAEACGWSCVDYSREFGPMWWVRNGLTVSTEELLDYLHDLNAMHSVIEDVIVRGKDIIQYRSNEDLFQAELNKLEEREQVPVWHFTAELYAEAFLRTKGLWKA